MQAFEDTIAAFRNAVQMKQNAAADDLLLKLKKQMIMMDTLPPINASGPTAQRDRINAREVYENAVLHAINCGDKDEFQRYMSCLRPYYLSEGTNASSIRAGAECTKETFLGLKLLYLLVENRLSEFHSEIELLTEAELSHRQIAFCTQIEQHVMVGAYEQVMESARNAPCRHYSFFLSSLMETVRINVAECIQAAYKSLTLRAAMQLMMFNVQDGAAAAEALSFIQKSFPHWTVVRGADADSTTIEFTPKVASTASEEIPSHKIMHQVLTYAAELERIV